MHNVFRRLPALLSVLIAPATLAAGTVLSAPETVTASAGGAQDDGAPEVVFAEMKFEDALSRAERTETMLVVLWIKGQDTPATIAFRDGIFGDTAVRRWLANNATVVRIDADVDKVGARGNLLPSYPAVDVLDLKRGGRIERLLRGSTAIDFLAAVYGAESDSNTLTKPTGVEATEPFRWLAWANARYREGDVNAARDAIEGYAWCLRRADEYRPEFRARYFEFLLKRIAGAKMREPLAVALLNAERDHLAHQLRSGTATPRDVYDLTRVDFWRRKELETRDLYIELLTNERAQPFCCAGLFDVAVPIMGRFRQYDEILAGVGDVPVDLFRARVEALTAGLAPVVSPSGPVVNQSGPVVDPSEAGADQSKPIAEPPATEPAAAPAAPRLRNTIPDTRGNIIDDASWVYEALLTAGRGADAKDLLAYVGQIYPLGRTYGLFMERAMRLEMWTLAAEIADTGISVVDARGRKRLQRLQRRIPMADATAGDGGHQDSDQ